jgi:hypothetical protein
LETARLGVLETARLGALETARLGTTETERLGTAEPERLGTVEVGWLGAFAGALLERDFFVGGVFFAMLLVSEKKEEFLYIPVDVTRPLS